MKEPLRPDPFPKEPHPFNPSDEYEEWEEE